MDIRADRGSSVKLTTLSDKMVAQDAKTSRFFNKCVIGGSSIFYRVEKSRVTNGDNREYTS